MPERTKVGAQDNRRHHRAMVLSRLYRDGPETRSGLAHLTGLTPPTVSAVVADLAAEHLVRDIGPRAGVRVGKPASLVTLDDTGRHVIALDLSRVDHFHGAVVDLRGRVVLRMSQRIGPAAGEAARSVLALAARLCAASPSPPIGVGISSPGIIDDRGVVVNAVHLDWHDLELAVMVSDRVGLPVRVGNDADMMSLGVLHFRDAPTRNLITVSLLRGIGVGIVIDGRVVRGEQFAAGEVAHVTVAPRGHRCFCGGRGCLDAEVNPNQVAPRLAGLTGDERAAALTETGAILGHFLTPLISALNLAHVAVVGSDGFVGGPLLEATRATIGSRVLPGIADGLSFQQLDPTDDIALLGAASHLMTTELGVP